MVAVRGRPSPLSHRAGNTGPRQTEATMAARKLAATVTVLAAATSMAVATAGPAAAKGSDVRASGSCSSSGHWKLKASDEGKRLEVELEVESGRAGQTWAVTISDNG